jgi:hypothetical protein
MNKIMKNQTLIFLLNKLVISLCAIVISASLLASCSDDPESTNEEEVVTTVIITLDPEEVEDEDPGEIVTLSWDDTNLDAIVDASEVIISGPLLANKTYGASIQILNKSVDPEIDISAEVLEEAEEHIFCFIVLNVNISITSPDEDRNGLPLGLTSTWSTTSVSTGTVNIMLRHQPGVKTGDCPGVGDTDVDITFPVSIEIPEE